MENPKKVTAEVTSDNGMEHEDLNRGLKNRHVQMIAIGGAIGVGLFYGSAGAIQLAGPSVLLCYALAGIIIFFVMRAVGEMSVAEPVSGAYVSYGSRYIHPFVGFMLSWGGLFTTIAAAGAEYNALGQYIQFWFPNIPIWLSALCVLILITTINLVAVSAYGETEFWLSLVKVVTICVMIIVGLLIVLFGVGHGGNPVGFANLTANGGFFAGGLKGFIEALALVCLAFGGVESVAIAAGETKDVKKTMPKAVNSVFFRILIFYIGSIFIMLCLQPWNKIGTTGSPFVTVFSMIGIPAAASIINFVVITAAMSSGNSGIYTYSRMMYNLSLQGQAPKIISKVNKKKVPYVAILSIVGAQLIGVLANAVIPATAFAIFSSILVTFLIEVWLVILISHVGFRKAKIKSGEFKDLTFKMPFAPYSNYVCIVFFILVLVVMGFMPATRIAIIVTPCFIFCQWVAYMIMKHRQKSAANK